MPPFCVYMRCSAVVLPRHSRGINLHAVEDDDDDVEVGKKLIEDVNNYVTIKMFSIIFLSLSWGYIFTKVCVCVTILLFCRI